jgi:hypothetical protein
MKKKVQQVLDQTRGRVLSTNSNGRWLEIEVRVHAGPEEDIREKCIQVIRDVQAITQVHSSCIVRPERPVVHVPFNIDPREEARVVIVEVENI